MLLTIGGLAASAVAEDAPRDQAASRPPNVVLIISDDQAWTDYGFLGHEHVRTPRLDQLARESAVFPRGYVPTALCRPSLATILTGLYAHQHGITGNDPGLADGGPAGQRNSAEYRQLCERLISHIDRVPTLPRLLAAKGYASFQSGKWWEGNYRRGGFTAGMTHGDPQRGGRHGDEGLKIGRQGLQPVFDFLAQNGDQPFLLWYAPFLPHTPHNPPARLLEKYQQAGRPEALAKYWAMCEWFDETCGQLLDYLDEHGLRENTLVVYVTDNGWIQRTEQTEVPAGWSQAYAPRSKQSAYDGGTRTPIMFRWPGKIPPGTHSSVVSSIDIAPTVLAACGVEAPRELPGVNLLDACQGRPLTREAIFGEGFAHDVADVDDPSRSLLYRWCIEGRWKLLLNYNGQLGRYKSSHKPRIWEPQLFDLLEDPFETRNVAAEHAEVVERMAGKIKLWWNASLPPGK
ncbi:MAG: sulfatase [Pirellulaceae bacterium]|nr:sulfatase [Pirellulaceae bacterium]